MNKCLSKVTIEEYFYEIWRLLIILVHDPVAVYWPRAR